MTHPRLAMYSGNDPNGYPYAPDKAIDFEMAAEAARMDIITLDIDGTYYFLHYLRTTNPALKILGLIRGPAQWGGMVVKEHDRNSYWSQLKDALVHSNDPATDCYIHTANSGWGIDGKGNSNINLANKKAREAFVSLALKHAKPFDGLFLDHWTPNPRWMEDANDPVVEVDGTPFDWPAYFEGRAWCDKQFADAGIPVYGNGGPTKVAGFAGWMVENFPWQSGGFQSEGPREGGWYSALMPNPWPSTPDYQKMRFTLGTACLFDSYACFVNSAWDRLRGHSPFMCDEMLVDKCGRSSDWYQGGEIHWLGEGIEPAMRAGQRSYIRKFEHGIVVVNPGNYADPIVIPAGYRAILGEITPAVNHGGKVAVVSLPANDARFLWRQ